MFFRILKKDLKRKKTMNIVLLLFIILSSMFASASASNIAAVTGGIELYFDEANVPDYIINYLGENDAYEKIAELDCVSDLRVEHLLFITSSSNFRYKGKKLDSFIGISNIISADEMAINYFDKDNNIIKEVEKGTFYATAPFTHNTDIKEGDEIEIDVCDTKMKMTYAGRFKGAIFSALPTANPVLLFNPEDFNKLSEEEIVHFQNFRKIYLNSTDEEAVKKIADEYEGVSLYTRDSYKLVYLYDLFAAYIMMAISIVLMVTAFAVLRFAIGFTITEEFREIGVMKAVGINNKSIRSLYITKYFAIAVVGAAIGFFCSLPLADMMLKNVTANMVLSSNTNTMIGLIGTVAVVIIILMFCYLCTRNVKDLSPIDAVRNGQTGERFGKKSVLHLGRSKLPSTGFLALNDIFSSPKQFAIITVIFSLCLLMITLLSNFALTLKSENILWLFDVPTSEAHILDSDYLVDTLLDQVNCEKIINETEKKLADNGIPAKCTITCSSSYKVTKGDRSGSITFSITKGHTDDVLRVDEGSAPQKPDEIAMTVSALKSLDAEIGDTITAEINDKKYDFIITGRYSSFSSNSAFLYRDFDLRNIPSNGCMGLQIHFEGDPDTETINKNIEKVKELCDTNKVYTSAEFIKKFTGISDTLNTFKHMMIIITVIVTLLIVILMERSFISKEKSEIALMKAIGIDSFSIICQHTLRFTIAAVAACIIDSIVLIPLSNFGLNKICLLIGDVSGIKCDYNILEVFVCAPLLLIGITAAGTFLTALYTNTVKPSDTASIE